MQIAAGWVLCVWLTVLLAIWIRVSFSHAMRTMAKFICDEDTSPTAFNGLIGPDDAPRQYAGDPNPWPKVTIITPGRNEGHVLSRTLGSLCQLDYPNFHVIFVDDQSTDNTRDVCRELMGRYPHLQVIHHHQSPPAGWGGKVWAIQQAVDMIDGDLVLFTDSDIWHHPQSLRKMVQLQHHRNIDMLSLLPRMETGSLLEQAVMLMAQHALMTMAPLYRSNDPANPTPLTAGAYMLFRTSAYRSMGGHESIRTHLIEDLALGTQSRSKGLTVFTVCTRKLLSGRMYEGLMDTFCGMKKNAYAGLRSSPIIAFFTTIFMLLAGVCIPLYLIFSVIALCLHPALPWAVAVLLALALNAIFFFHFEQLRRLTCQKPGSPFFMPLGMLFCLGVIAASMWDYYVRGGSVWSGRVYARREVDINATILTGERKSAREV
jgi:cellulose synthase/poly-beta-1,6-N-acetylglucosamine synthase-like glycosyltransferase